ncbi:MAG: hypothetical protein OEY89_06505, partial [Gammaproteobacteria bacterium]|nr:hypothetical protein [Gammaproteobacteria bacterium]
AVRYVFEVDFDANNSTYTNSAGTWNYFYTEYVSGSIINGMNRDLGYTGFNFFNSYGNIGEIVGSHYEAKIFASANFTTDWMVQDWAVGQQFKAIDGGCFAGGASGCAVYAYSDVTLTAITPVPIPASFVLFLSGLYGLRLVSSKPHKTLRRDLPFGRLN